MIIPPEALSLLPSRKGRCGLEVVEGFSSEQSKPRMMTNPKEEQIKSAAKHFEKLYEEEIQLGEVTSDTIHEWWTQTVHQYSELESSDLEEIEKQIKY